MEKVSVLPKKEFVTIVREREERRVLIAHDIDIDIDVVGKITAIGGDVLGVSVGDTVVFDRVKSARMKNLSGDGEFYVTREKNIKLKICA